MHVLFFFKSSHSVMYNWMHDMSVTRIPCPIRRARQAQRTLPPGTSIIKVKTEKVLKKSKLSLNFQLMIYVSRYKEMAKVHGNSTELEEVVNLK